MAGTARRFSGRAAALMVAALSGACSLDERNPNLPADAGSVPSEEGPKGEADGGPQAPGGSSPDGGDDVPDPECPGDPDCEEPPPTCTIGGATVAANAVNPENACQICDPARGADAYSVNSGASCGSAATECSGQDTCNAQGECVPNDLPSTTACSSQPEGRCNGSGACVDLRAGREPINLASLADEAGGGYVIRARTGEVFEIVSSGRDVNGDGRADILAGSPGAPDRGAAYLVFGQDRTTALTLDSFLNGQGPGFRIAGAPPAGTRNAGIGSDVILLGDVNGGGTADLVVTWWTENFTTGSEPGASYVIFGKANSQGVSAQAIADVLAGSGGFAINGVGQLPSGRHFVAGAGDQNADGLEDILVPLFVDQAQSVPVRVVFGKSTLTPAGTTAADGFDIVTDDVAFQLQSMAAAGDVNGDGRSDILLAAQRFRDQGQGSVVYVIFGRETPETINLSDIEAGGGGGFVLRDVQRITENDLLGTSLAAAGDINGDGLGDLVIGSQNALVDGNFGAGRVYVVFGKSDEAPLDLGPIAAGEGGGFAIDGAFGNEQSGQSVAGIGDQNGDGIRDVLLGAPNFSAEVGAGAGAVYVVYGKADPARVELSDLQQGARGGFAIYGPAASQAAGRSVAAGDVNGDGTDDIVTIAGGDAYVVFGVSP